MWCPIMIKQLPQVLTLPQIKGTKFVINASTVQAREIAAVMRA